MNIEKILKELGFKPSELIDNYWENPTFGSLYIKEEDKILDLTQKIFQLGYDYHKKQLKELLDIK